MTETTKTIDVAVFGAGRIGKIRGIRVCGSSMWST
jgi:hypothetical protein